MKHPVEGQMRISWGSPLKVHINPNFFFFCLEKSLYRSEQNGEKNFCFWLKPDFFTNYFQSGGNSRFENPLPSRGSLPKGNGSSVIRDVKPGLRVSQVVTSIRGEAMPGKCVVKLQTYASPLLICLMLMSGNYVTRPSLPFTRSRAEKIRKKNSGFNQKQNFLRHFAQSDTKISRNKKQLGVYRQFNVILLKYPPHT